MVIRAKIALCDLKMVYINKWNATSLLNLKYWLVLFLFYPIKLPVFTWPWSQFFGKLWYTHKLQPLTIQRPLGLVRKRTQLEWNDLILLSYAFCLICVSYIEHITSPPSSLGLLTVKWLNDCFTHRIVDKKWATYCHQAFMWEEPSALKHSLKLLAMLIYRKWDNLLINDSRTRWQPPCNTGLYRRLQDGTWNPLPSNILINFPLLAY